MADRVWDEDDWESVWTEGRVDLGKEDGGSGFFNDQYGKHNDDNCDDDCRDSSPAMFR